MRGRCCAELGEAPLVSASASVMPVCVSCQATVRLPLLPHPAPFCCATPGAMPVCVSIKQPCACPPAPPCPFLFCFCRCDAYATEFDLEAEEYVPLPKGDVHKRKEVVQVGLCFSSNEWPELRFWSKFWLNEAGPAPGSRWVGRCLNCAGRLSGWCASGDWPGVAIQGWHPGRGTRARRLCRWG